MSMLPEEFLLILTVFMAMGAQRMSRERVLARRTATIEALGAATVLCTDKTGTLTENRMAIAELAVPAAEKIATWTSAQQGLPETFNELVEYGLLACERDPLDPMDKAFLALADERLPPGARHDDWTLAHEYGLSDELLAMTHVWQAPGSTVHAVAVKGAHEAVALLCRLEAGPTAVVAQAAQDMAGRGLRVLAVARATLDGTDWPATPQGFDFTFLGLVGLADPLRAAVPAAVRECLDAGIRVVMITGDHPLTARAIALQAGLVADGETISGTELAAMSDAELGQRAAKATVFARVLPEQKLRIINALQAGGEVVAMTGDGVNDAPSLKAAHIGIAMGARGTDVAREASALVLLDDDFSAIVKAIRLGRRIYDNLRKAMAFTFAVHVPIAGLSLLPLLFGLPLVFSPVHIAFLELLISPVCSIVFESEVEEDDVMKRRPRDPAAPLFSAPMIAGSLLQGALVLVLVGGFFVALLGRDVDAALARAAAFTALVACSVALIIANRSFSGHLIKALCRPNRALWRMMAVTAALLAAVLLIAPLRRLFQFAPLTPTLLAAALALGIGALLVLEAIKALISKFGAPAGAVPVAATVR
jgi:Ca2+-transporting ATPase